MRTARLLATVAIPALMAASAAYAAQPAFPDKPIRLIIGSAPGSGPDIMARLIAEHLYGAWGQRVVVDTRPGDRKSTRLNSSHLRQSRMPSSA